MAEIHERPDGRIDIQITPEQFMRDANAAAREANKICQMLGIESRPIPYPDIEKEA
jgi:hypothetical protein